MSSAHGFLGADLGASSALVCGVPDEIQEIPASMLAIRVAMVVYPRLLTRFDIDIVCISEFNSGTNG